MSWLNQEKERKREREKKARCFSYRIAIMQFFVIFFSSSPLLSFAYFFFAFLSLIFFMHIYSIFYVILRYVFASASTYYFGLLHSVLFLMQSL